MNLRTGWKKSGALLALLALLSSTGCYGRFTLTRSLYKWNADVTSDRYVRSMLFWPLSILYAGAAIIDALVINVMEFWSGDRVVDEARVLEDGTQVRMMSAGHGTPLVITVNAPQQLPVERQVIALSKTQFEVRDAAGTALGTIEKQAGGRYAIFDTQHRPVGEMNGLQGVTAL